jgi:hypothetical protein
LPRTGGAPAHAARDDPIREYALSTTPLRTQHRGNVVVDGNHASVTSGTQTDAENVAKAVIKTVLFAHSEVSAEGGLV